MNRTPWRPSRWDAAAALCLALLFAALAVRAVGEDRWSDWAFGDALTLLSLRQWDENGWLANRLLMLPQGYAAPIRHLDDPDLRQHAHGISYGSSPRVGPRLWYTHYPAGYLVPQALLTGLGLGSMAALRLLALTFSVAALGLMYLVFTRLAGAPAAFVAAAFYALSPAFLGYADSLANQPLDDLLRFGFMLAVVVSTRAGAAQTRRAALVAAWVMEFVLSLSSYDSVFFVYLWLVGWDVLETRRPHWRKWLAFAAAPVSAFGLCFLQNVWYLGWTDAARDIVDAFLMKSPAESAVRLEGRAGLDAIPFALFVVVRKVFTTAWLLPVFAAILLLRRAVAGNPARGLPAGVLALLLVCGASFVIVLPKTVWMAYEARQLMPFAALLTGGLATGTAGDLGTAWHALQTRPARGRGAALTLLLVGAAAALALLLFGRIDQFRRDRERVAAYAIPAGHPSVRVAKDLRQMRTELDAIFFDLDGFGAYLDLGEAPDYPHIHPALEYYVGARPILAFGSERLAAQDLERLARRAPRQFSPVLVSRDLEALAGIVAALDERGLLLRIPDRPSKARDVHVLDLTPVMNW